MAPSRRSKWQATAPLLKGYLPVRLCLPPTADGREDDTYFYVKEHRDNNSSSSSSSSSTSSTLFVANAPVVPPVATKLLLQSIFGRFGDVTRVTVVPNPRQQQQQQSVTTTASLDEGIFWTDHFAAPSYFLHGKSATTREDEKRFAHIVFSSPKEMKACLQSLHQVMAASSSEDEKTTSDHAKKDESDSDSSDEEEDEDEDGSSQDDNDKDDQRNAQSPGLVLDPIELQTLADETDRLYRQEHGLDAVESSDIDSDDEQEKRRKQREAKKKKKRSPVVIVAERYRESSCTTQSDRQALLEECNRVMQEYEDEQARQLAASTGNDGEPAVDDDGFVTVTYGGAAGGDVGSGSGKRALDDAPVHEQGQKRRKGQKRSRGSATGKKKRTGASQLDDFYRFQTKDNKKKTLHELRERFEQDLAKVQKMKQERKYRPF